MYKIADPADAVSVFHDVLRNDADADLRVGLWGGRRAPDKHTALYKLVHDTRRLFTVHGVNGGIIEKAQGRTRLRLDANRMHLGGAPRS